ncbi:MAG: hypothetical protein N2487_01210 [Verrucomicrobiae bacterium]|nr:hypothetical protein [Verrucomicrobiae bacterium]
MASFVHTAQNKKQTNAREVVPPPENKYRMESDFWSRSDNVGVYPRKADKSHAGEGGKRLVNISFCAWRQHSVRREPSTRTIITSFIAVHVFRKSRTVSLPPPILFY